MNKWVTVYSENKIEQLEVPDSYSKMELGKVMTYYQRDNRFKDDQLFISDEKEMVVLDGVILNSKEIEKKYNCTSLSELLRKKDKPLSYPFFEEFTGPFCGVTYDLKTNLLLAFGNHTGDAPVFYYNTGGLFLVSNDLDLLLTIISSLKRTYSFNEKAAHYIMTYGYMIDDSTLIEEIKRLMPGGYLTFNGKTVVLNNYFSYKQKEVNISIEDAVEAIDAAFRKAVKRCFDKDLEYGYCNHLADISGGLDSRMVTWVASDLGYSSIINISYSQSMSDEYKCAREVTHKLNTVLLHRQLDDASFLFNVEEIVKMEYGLAPYFGITGGNQMLKLVNPNTIGLEHTGQLGDVILGAYTEHDMPINSPYKRYSYLIDDPGLDSSIISKYDTLEEFLVNTRGFMGILATHLIRRHYTYAVSPFLDIDFVNTCLSIPMKFKRRHLLYWEWIDKKYPEAGRIRSTRLRSEHSFSSLIYRAKGKTRRYCKALMFRLGIIDSPNDTNNMNPIQFWYDTNKDLRVFVDKYFEDNSYLLNDYVDTKMYIDTMMNSDNVIDKLLGLTVLGVLSLYFRK